MSSSLFNRNKFLKPEIFLAELLEHSVNSSFIERGENVRILHRALVIAVDVNGGKLENPGGDGNLIHEINGKSLEVKALIGPTNPRNSIKARIITDDHDQFFSNDDVRVYWPLFTEHIAVPIKPGEHAYVMFEDSDSEHGLWIGKVAGHENANIFRGKDSYKPTAGKLASIFPDTQSEDEDSDMYTDEASGGRFVSDDRLTKMWGED